jgi:hypothetical protein
LPPYIGDNIQYDDPKTMEETIRRSKCLYEQQRSLPYGRLGKKRRNSRWIKGRRELSLSFS